MFSFLSLATVLMLVLVGLALGFLSAIGYALWHWIGGWRWLAVVPLLYVIVSATRLILEVSADPTSHNLWPFEMIVTIVFASALLGGLYLVRLVVVRTERSERQ